MAGDVNRDGLVDGVDSQLLSGALGSFFGDAAYAQTLDLDRDGSINTTDMQILGSNFGFIANRPPVVTATNVLTHTDLETSVDLVDLVTDPEGDSVFYRFLNPVNGTVSFSPDGSSARFLPTPNYTGTASFDKKAVRCCQGKTSPNAREHRLQFHTQVLSRYDGWPCSRLGLTTMGTR